MKKCIVILFLFFTFSVRAQNLKKGDTLFINYFIASGEFGGRDEGILVYYSDHQLKAKAVRLNKTSYGIPLIEDSIVSFYKKNRNNFTLIKEEWILDSIQIAYVFKLKEEKRKESLKKMFSAMQMNIMLCLAEIQKMFLLTGLVLGTNFLN